ncbi:hypothetical protein CLOM_g324 [Closterium sp. NIES-68]|nr:hypothetical protein CLOM_g324 [Closterium sp. NIES-68]GJP80171.1 hypothetical protein CLOP_g10394 [Closterium sp. NIES-67]
MGSVSADYHQLASAPCQDHRRNQTCCCHSRKRKSYSDELDGELDTSSSPPKRGRDATRSSPATSSPYVFPEASQRLGDYFEMDSRILGTGKFGTVRRCTCRSTGVQYACKSISKATLIEADDIEDVRREVRLLRQAMGHPGIMRLHAVFEDDRDVHLVTELCDGGDLFDEIARRGRFSERDAAQVFMQVASAVAFCHSRGVMHRDIKPENILLSSSPLLASETTSAVNPASNSAENLEESQPFLARHRSYHSMKLADFGLAVPLDRGETTTGPAGSPYYMAPEVITGDYGLPADVWSLGVVLHILLSGSPPFWGPDDQGILDSVVKGRVDLGGECAAWAGARVSAEARGLIRCMLERDPRRRPSASKLLSHPWLLLHAFGGRIMRKAKGCVHAEGGNPAAGTSNVIVSNVGAAGGR